MIHISENQLHPAHVELTGAKDSRLTFLQTPREQRGECLCQRGESLSAYLQGLSLDEAGKLKVSLERLRLPDEALCFPPLPTNMC